MALRRMVAQAKQAPRVEKSGVRGRQFWRLACSAKLGYEAQAMNAVILKAHYYGKHICLDYPYPLEAIPRLLVMVVPVDTAEEERQAWLAASQAWFARAYGENKPDYSGAVIREQPPRE